MADIFDLFKKIGGKKPVGSVTHLVVGLGNPGKDYAFTRHNTGFDTLDLLAEKYRIDIGEKKHKALIGKGMIEGNRGVLVKPQTYMNLSGESVREVLDYYKADEEEDLIVIYDDVSLVPGQIRIRDKGSAGGHNGIKNIIAHLGHDRFMRIKIGVGERRYHSDDLKDWVLSRLPAEQREDFAAAIEKACLAAEEILARGIDSAMNRYSS